VWVWCLCSEMSLLFVSVRASLENVQQSVSKLALSLWICQTVNERSRVRRSTTQHGVVGFIQGGQHGNLFTTCLLAAILCCMVIRLMCSEKGVFVLSPLRW